MMPMQPFQPTPPLPSTVAPRRELPGYLKTILGFKVVGSLLTMGMSVFVLMVFSDESNRPVGASSEFMHRLALLAVLAAGSSMIELFGVAGTWAMKRWGVYTLVGFTMLGFVFRLQGGDTSGAIIGVASTMIAGLTIAMRWKDFD